MEVPTVEEIKLAQYEVRPGDNGLTKLVRIEPDDSEHLEAMGSQRDMEKLCKAKMGPVKKNYGLARDLDAKLKRLVDAGVWESEQKAFEQAMEWLLSGEMVLGQG
jgi:hypothetical protein